MHMYAKHIGEVIKEHYCPEDMMCSETAHEDLKELGEWVDIMKDLAAFDRDIGIIEAMKDADAKDIVERSWTTGDVIAKAKHIYSTLDVAGKAAMKAELTKLVQGM